MKFSIKKIIKYFKLNSHLGTWGTTSNGLNTTSAQTQLNFPTDLKVKSFKNRKEGK